MGFCGEGKGEGGNLCGYCVGPCPVANNLRILQNKIMSGIAVGAIKE